MMTGMNGTNGVKGTNGANGMNGARTDVRLLEDRDMEQAYAIWDACFGDSPEFRRWYFETRAEPSRAIGLFEGGELISDTLMIPYPLRLRGKAINAPYIVGAATHERHRRKGHMERVLAAALGHMRELGAGITLLHPFRYGFYRRLGWECATNMLSYTTGAERLALCPAGEFSPIERGGGAAMLPIYMRMARKAGVALARGVRECEFRIEETLIEGGFGLIGENAYALFYEQGGKLDAHELCYTDMRALIPLLGALARRAGVKSVSFLLPAFEPAPPFLADEPPPRLLPYMMMRVVNAEAALTGLNFPGLYGGARIELTDALCPWNNGLFHMELSGGWSKARRMYGDIIGVKPERNASPGGAIGFTGGAPFAQNATPGGAFGFTGGANCAPGGAGADARMDVTTLSMLISGYMSYASAKEGGYLCELRENPLLYAAFEREYGFILEKY